MERERRRWRIRIGTLMLLVVIAALGVALVIERRRNADLERQLAAANARLPRYITYPAVMRPGKSAARPQNSAPATTKLPADAR